MLKFVHWLIFLYKMCTTLVQPLADFYSLLLIPLSIVLFGSSYAGFFIGSAQKKIGNQPRTSMRGGNAKEIK